MASFAIPLVLGSFAAFGAAFGGGVDGATGKSLSEEVSDSEEVSKVESEDELPEPKESTPPPEPEIPTPPPEPQPEAKPEPVAGGAIGRPTWAPISQSAPISLSTPGATGSAGIFAKITGSYKKGPADFQSELKDIDDQLRVLRAREFLFKESVNEKTNALNTSREKYYTDFTTITKNEKLVQFYDKKINDLLKPESSANTGKYSEIVKKLFPQQKKGNGEYIDEYAKADKKQLDFQKWSDSALEFFRSREDDPVGIKPEDSETADVWWKRISGLTASATEKSGKDDVETKFGKLIVDKNKALRELEFAKDSDSKTDYDGKIQDLKDLRSKLKDVQKQIKDLRDKRELILVDLSNYELPKGLFAEKSVPQKTTLPTGEERDQIIRSIKDVEQQIKEKQTEINDYISDNLNDKGTWMDGKEDGYNTKKTEMAKLKSSRDESILKLEGRTPQQKELLRDNELETLIKELLASKLVDKNGVKSVLVNSSFPKVFAMYRELSTADEKTIHEKIDRYYNFFTKAKTVGFTAFNGQDVSNAFSFLFLYTTDKYNISSELKNKIKEFLKTNKKLIADSLIKLELANRGIKTPTEETRDIIEQALMSGQAPFAKSLQRAVKSFDPSKYFGQTDKAKLERIIKDFRERIFNKTQVVYLKYGLWRQEIRLEEAPVQPPTEVPTVPLVAPEPVVANAEAELEPPAEVVPEPLPETTQKSTCSDILKTIISNLPDTEKGKKFSELSDDIKQLITNQLKTYDFTDDEIQECIKSELSLPPVVPEDGPDLNPFATGGNHTTRRHWVRSKRSRFTRHKIY